jgi:predicted kinase
MNISLQPALEARLREKAQAEGLSVEAYLESLLRAEEQADNELETLALEGLDSGEPIPIDAAYWEEKHRRLEERLKKKTGTR